jgi:hypothetical protein
LNIAEDFGPRTRVEATANRRSVAAATMLADNNSLRQGAVITDDYGGANHNSMRMIDDQPFADASARGNLGSRKNRVPVGHHYCKRSQMMEKEPMANTVKKYRVKTLIEKNCTDLVKYGGLLVGEV